LATFDEYVQMDLDVLEEVGVTLLPHSSTKNLAEWEAVTGVLPQELDAWKRYSKLGINSPIGRGLYSIQIQQLLDAMNRYGKSRDDLMVITSEDLKANTHGEYQRILKFLDLQPQTLKSYGGVNKDKTNHTMNPKTRERLRQFYAPYNRKLASLLGEDWQGIWE
jgi:hypothetical protein